MLSDLTETKEAVFYYRQQVQIITFFPKGLIQAFDQKMPNSAVFRFSQKTRNNA